MCKHFTILAVLLCFITLSTGVFAMIPRVKFPEWHNSDIKITDWNPAKGILTVTVKIEANKIPIKKVSSQPYLQSNFDKLLPKIERKDIKQGETVSIAHKLNVKNNTSNWLEMDVRALPDVAGLKILIRSEYANRPGMREILEAEADSIKSPVFIGTSMPIVVRDDIALSVTPELAFSPIFEHKGNKYYIWLPLDCAENQTTNSAIKLFREAVKSKKLKDIETTGQNLLKRFNTEKRTIVFKKVNGDNFAIPTKIAVEMLKSDIISIKAILSDNIGDLEKSYNDMNPCYAKAFVAYNLYAYFKSVNKIKEADKYKKEALDEQPAWPLLKN